LKVKQIPFFKIHARFLIGGFNVSGVFAWFWQFLMGRLMK